VIASAGGRLNTSFMGWGVGFFDYDNDGWPDVLIANGHVYPELEAHGVNESYRQRKILYHNRGHGALEDVSLSSGPGILLKRSSRGVAFADFDQDGDVDCVINNQNDSPTLLRNEGGNRQHWLSIQTVGTQSNRAGIGTRVKVVSGGRAQIDEVRSGGSYISQSDLRLHFGLGRATRVDWIELRWPSGRIDRLQGLPVDASLTVQEGKGIIAQRGP